MLNKDGPVAGHLPGPANQNALVAAEHSDNTVASLEKQRQSVFGQWQPVYAEHGIATIPIAIGGPDGKDKRPLIRHWQAFGVRGSNKICRNFADAQALAFKAGRRSKVSVLDIDSDDENILADALDRHGSTPIVVRTARGHFQGWFAFNGERRKIRCLHDDNGNERPIDVIGGGLVVAPPSRGVLGNYRFINGGLDDLGNLPIMRGLDCLTAVEPEPLVLPDDVLARVSTVSDEVVHDGRRGKALFDFCMWEAHNCGDRDDLLARARAHNNAVMIPPVTDQRVRDTVTSAWGYTERGENRYGRAGAWFPAVEVRDLADDADAFWLLAFLRATNGPHATFLITNSFAVAIKWTRKRFARARDRLIEIGYIRCVRGASRLTGPAQYRWAGVRTKKETHTVY